MRHVLAIDQGTTNTKALLVSEHGDILFRASSSLTTSYPQPGWAEQSAGDIWSSVQDVIAQIATHGTPVDAIGIANQRETLVAWDARTSRPICPAIIWQCRRTTDTCAALIEAGHSPQVLSATGLDINPLFPASKLAWILRNIDGANALAEAGHLRAGTVDAWLLWKLTAGEVFATDHSNASRTQLFDTSALRFSKELCGLFGVASNCLPRPMASDARFGVTAAGATALPEGVPIRAVMGDSHAALYGHGVRSAGTVKATFGTGSSLMTLMPARKQSSHGLSGTIAWTCGDTTAYALEGNITVSGQTATFMADILGVGSVQDLSDLAQTVQDAAGVTFVPALAGLGAPHWDDRATGTITGMTHGTKRAHLARAALEAIAHQVADVFAAMEQDVGHDIAGLRVDGGASANAFLMQIQSDILGRAVRRSTLEDVGALGVASMALGGDLSGDEGTVFLPEISPTTRAAHRDQWARALIKTRA